MTFIVNSLIPLAAYGTGSVINLIVRFVKERPPTGIDMWAVRELMLCSRMVIPGILGLVYLWWSGGRLINSSVSWRWYLMRGLLRYWATVCTYYGISQVHLQVSACIGLLEPFFVMFLSILTGYEKFSPAKSSWLTMAFLASALAYYSCLRVDDVALLPILVLLLANFLAATSAMIAKRMSAQESDVASSTIMSLVVACASLVTIYCYTDYEQIGRVEFEGWQVALTVLMGVVGGIHTLCFQIAIRKYQPSFVSSFQYTKVFFGMLLDWLVFYERPKWQVICSSLCVLYVIYRIALLQADQRIALLQADQKKLHDHAKM